MFEMLISPKKAERHPWELFFVGLFYASLSVLLVNWIFSQDIVLGKYSGILVITFSVIFSMPFVYYTVKYEESKDRDQDQLTLLKEHKKAIFIFLWLFLGFVIAYSFWFIILGSTQNFNAQIETYCVINSPNNMEDCINLYDIVENENKATGSFISGKDRVIAIFINNVYVLISTLIFSLIFGAGAIFILSWNASVISAAIVLFSNAKVENFPLGLARYMIHGIPEVAAYFIGALAGGILSISVIKHEIKNEKFWFILRDSLTLIIIAVLILFVASLVEVYITPVLF